MQNTLSNKGFDPVFASSVSKKIMENVSKIIVGKKDVIQYILISIYAGGHILLEGVPGVAKTLIAKTIARSLSLSYSRIQATPDLLPSDIIGTLVFDPRINDFKPRKGPIFANIVLFDEINRASPRTQSALLEAMQEKQVTIEGITFKLPEPFIVIATMNPIEMEGTFPLPEAQLDRFLLKIIVSYPDTDEEKEVLRRIHYIEKFEISPVTSAEEILAIKAMLPKVRVSEELIDYIVRIVKKTREHPHVRLGGSPRASISLLLTSKANALIDGRSYVIPDDIKFVAKPVLRHRIILKPEAEFEAITTDQIIEDVLNEIPVPTPGVPS
ncbi:ATPase associated with various cellular activities, AAA_3 [Staphylothermus marinus F1]|uniref:ATPase associated with various cellular activities, AAA_3 n=1 Tax=Staphylothermus marinus (strain ATCC 43588 / DSM 3639 / JCM 9404 / F1) TaxID=399550 RepID=A3DLP1_STAMF|nr:MoxR family ATPase [Staphylothermus marinus]ABN69551.1 ATPase associated with various cellular activities, AAA_3 [Staphylothermus marinus F1]